MEKKTGSNKVAKVATKRAPETAKAAAPQASAAEPNEAKNAAAKSKVGKTGKPDALTVPDKPEHEIALQPTKTDGVFHAVVHGKRAVICFHERNRGEAKNRFAAITLRMPRIDAAKAQAKTDSLPLFMGVQVRVVEKWDSGWLVTPALYAKLKSSATDFSLAGSARAAYAAHPESLVAVRFSVNTNGRKTA